MRKFLVSAAIAASALAAAAPAAAQYYPAQGYGYGYGYNYGHSHARRLDARIDALQRQIPPPRPSQYPEQSGSPDRLRGDANNLERRLRSASRYGLSGREAYDIERRIYRLETRIQREARDGNRYGQWGYNDYRGGWSDRDRDGRNDRYEDDRGYNHD